ncbi:hypothetical protein [Acinetobacter rudis]|uniref:Zinc ribbon domain-containing protein n=1 Tax=Acinetobacter rudis TaxID=632955 RepID=A0AAW8JC91_9GAMM|nr:hypothetical protein [Acinetobacter rudis]MDQ8936824.1 hypothetical protein [Acinetobacter rudis]MDQ8954090.1 hypothetical protein [Acinetobacter rudis]MDQ9019044.1 hypothetical protein [Acinetobacter rudis]
MLYRYHYHCACCNHIVGSDQKECPECGSHHIRSPISLWVFCVFACLIVVLLFTLVSLYVQVTRDTSDLPISQSIFEVIKKN